MPVQSPHLFRRKVAFPLHGSWVSHLGACSVALTASVIFLALLAAISVGLAAQAPLFYDPKWVVSTARLAAVVVPLCQQLEAHPSTLPATADRLAQYSAEILGAVEAVNTAHIAAATISFVMPATLLGFAATTRGRSSLTTRAVVVLGFTGILCAGVAFFALEIGSPVAWRRSWSSLGISGGERHNITTALASFVRGPVQGQWPEAWLSRPRTLELWKDIGSISPHAPVADELLACLAPASGVAVASSAIGALAVAAVLAAIPVAQPKLSMQPARRPDKASVADPRSRVDSEVESTVSGAVPSIRRASLGSHQRQQCRLNDACLRAWALVQFVFEPQGLLFMAALAQTSGFPVAFALPLLCVGVARDPAKAYADVLVVVALSYFWASFMSWFQQSRSSHRITCSVHRARSKEHQQFGRVGSVVGIRSRTLNAAVLQKRRSREHREFSAVSDRAARRSAWTLAKCLRDIRRIGVATPEPPAVLLFVLAVVHLIVAPTAQRGELTFGHQAIFPIFTATAVSFPATVSLLAGIVSAVAAKATRTQLHQSGEALRAFTGYISHSTRVPLNAAQLAADELREDILAAVEDGRLDSDTQAMLDILQTSLGAARTVLDDVLTLESSLQRGASSLRPTWVPGREILGPVRSMFETAAGDAVSALAMHSSAALAGHDIYVDHTRLTQVRRCARVPVLVVHCSCVAWAACERFPLTRGPAPAPPLIPPCLPLLSSPFPTPQICANFASNALKFGKSNPASLTAHILIRSQHGGMSASRLMAVPSGVSVFSSPTAQTSLDPQGGTYASGGRSGKGRMPSISVIGTPPVIPDASTPIGEAARRMLRRPIAMRPPMANARHGTRSSFTDDHSDVESLSPRGSADQRTWTSAALVIQAIDQGDGIGDDDRPNLFRAFAQVEAGVATKGVGTGLGLAVSAALAQAMGGTVGHAHNIASASGSIFWFAVPVAVVVHHFTIQCVYTFIFFIYFYIDNKFLYIEYIITSY